MPTVGTYSRHELPSKKGTEILRSTVGSTLYGTSLDTSNSDRDEMGIYLEPITSMLGLGHSDTYVWRTQPDGVRSGAGDTDLTVYPLHHWANLALKGNPSILLLLFAPDEFLLINSALGQDLRDNSQWFASIQAGNAFLGYMEQQRQRMTGQRGKAGRVRVMPDGEVDWKYAMHMLRLGYQGVEFLETGRLTLPCDESLGEHLRNVRRGLLPLPQVIQEAEVLEERVKELFDDSPLPPNPDYDAVERFLILAHTKSISPGVIA